MYIAYITKCYVILHTYITYVYIIQRFFQGYIHIVIVIVIFIWWSPFIPSRNLDEVFTYNHVWL